MSSVESNFHDRFFSKLSELRIWEKYSDVTIECGVTSFACHRIVLAAGCEYFGSMFGSGFEESVTGKVVLHDVDAESFDLVLQFLYSGKLVIDVGSIYNLIRISDFMGIKDLEELCVRFVSENRRIINVVELYQLALILNKKVLIDMLGSCDMTEQLEEYFKSDAHLGLPYDAFAMIVKRWNASSQDAIVRWTNACIETRGQYFDELVKTHAEATIPDLGTSLYVLVNCLGFEHLPSVKVCAINDAHSTTCSLLADLQVNEDDDQHVTDQYVVSDRSRLFILSRNYWHDTMHFFMSESVDMRPTCSLKRPPISVNCDVGDDNFLLCDMPKHGIYLYDRNLLCRLNGPETNFTYEEINRGIIFYDYSVDDWFSVPRMKKCLMGASMAVLDDRVYLVDGYDPGYMQAYDHRAGTWLEMPKAKTHYRCCATMNGAIYVCGSGGGTNVAEKFNIVAGKWEQITPPPIKYYRDSSIKMFPYAGHLWMFNYDYDIECLLMYLYDPVPNSWRVIREPSIERCVGRKFKYIETSFVFKSL